MGHHHSHIGPHWPKQPPDGVEGPGQPGAESVPVLEHDHEELHCLDVSQEPGQQLQVVPAGIEAGCVYDRDPGAVLEAEPGPARVGALQCPRLEAVTHMEWLEVSRVVIESPAQQRIAQT